jgi:CubicO group peptidase (beta-lactamase class C family)
MRAFDLLTTWPVDTAAVAVIGRVGVLGSAGPDVALPWASVTKPVTALTALLAVARGEISLDEPAGPPGSTIRHLLAHASGVGFDDRAPIAAPGKRRIYSNAGFEVLAETVSARAGRPFDELMAETVFAPLGMTGSTLAGSPAHGIVGPVSDLARIGRELLEPTLAPALTAEAARVAFPGLAGVVPGYGRQNPNDWGLGFEIRNGKSPHWTGSRNSPATFGHFGKSGSFLWVDPAAGCACACLTGREFGEWAGVWPPFSDAVLAELDE